MTEKRTMGPKPELYRRHRPTCKIGKRDGSSRRGFDPGCDCPVWRDYWLPGGQRFNKSTGTSDWTEALVWCMTYPAGEVPVASPAGTEHAYGVRPAPAGEMTLAAAIEKYLVQRQLDFKQKLVEESSITASAGTLAAFGAITGAGTYLSAITKETFDGYRAQRLAKTERRPGGLSISSLGKEIRHLAAWWHWLEREGHAPKKLAVSTFTPPADTSDEQKVGFSSEQVEAIKSAIDRIPSGGQHTAEPDQDAREDT